MASKLLGFDFSVEYKSGATSVVADALSRCHGDETGEVTAISPQTFEIFDDLRREIDTDPELLELKQGMVAGDLNDDWAMVDGLITMSGHVFVPLSSASLPALLASADGTSHEGIQKTLHRLCVDFQVLGAWEVVRDFVRACAMCQRNKIEQLQPTGLLQPLAISSVVWVDIAMDFVEGLPRVNGKSVILTVVDRFSKYAHFITLAHPYTATSVARGFFNGIV
jgi:hypothetical protein